MIRLMGVHCVFGLLLLSVSLAKTHANVLPNGPDFDVWDADQENANSEGKKLLAILCENYQLQINDENIDCQSIQFGTDDLSPDDYYHVISKREAGDEELEEGSGNAENEQPEISLFNKDALPAQELNNSSNAEDTNKETAPAEVSAGAEAANSTEEKPTVNEEKPALNEEKPATDEEKQAVDEEKPAVEKGKSAIDEEKPAAVAKPSEDESVGQKQDNVDQQTASNTTENTEEHPKENELGTGIVNVKSASLPADEETGKTGDTENEEANVESSNNKPDSKTDLVHPPSEHEIPRAETTLKYQEEGTTAAPTVQQKEESAIASSSTDEDISRAATQKVPSSIANDTAPTTPPSKESEVVDDHQSSNAELLKEPKMFVPVSVEGSESDKQLAGIATKANVNSHSTDPEQPNTGESAKNVSKAGKDTTILIVLFVVVIVIGAAAFTHNFIKKRKQKNEQESEVANGIRRSLQNLTGNGKNSTDIEQGTEMKPLMKTNSPTTVNEYSDAKKEAEA